MPTRIVDPKKTYVAVTPQERYIIINKINNGWLPHNPDCEVVKSRMYAPPEEWKDGVLTVGKHHPENIIPQRIYLLGDGKPEDIFRKYNSIYTNEAFTGEEPTSRSFKSYFRELLKIGIFKVL